MNEMEESHFYPDSAGKFNVPIQNLKRTKSRGKGKLFFLRQSTDATREEAAAAGGGAMRKRTWCMAFLYHT